MAEETMDAGKEFNVETPLGKLSTKGYHLGNVLQMVIAVILTVMAMMIYDTKTATATAAATLAYETKLQVEQVRTLSKEEHEKITRDMDRTIEAINDMSYLMTLPQTKREQINLAMPESLRRRLRDR